MPDTDTVTHAPAHATCADRAQLHRLLDQGLQLQPEYGPGFSSHLPMALQALHAMGASHDRLQAFHARQAARFAPRMPEAAQSALTRSDWVAARGEAPAFEPLAAYFSQAVRREGIEDALRRHLPYLLPGVTAAAFHGLLRTAHGCAAGHAGEVALGLAYWAARYQSLGPLSAGPDDLGMDAWLHKVVALRPAARPAGRMIVDRMQAAARLPGFARAVSRLQLSPSTPAGLAAASAELYARGGDFTVLHMVTASNALRRLLPFAGDEELALAWFSQAAAAALLASGAGTPPRTGPAPRPWTVLVEQAIASDDEHVIKLVQAAQAGALASGDPVFQRAADRAVSDAHGG